MTDIEKAQKLSKEIGHCLCSLIIKCPCLVYTKLGKCKCADNIENIDIKSIKKEINKPNENPKQN